MDDKSLLCALSEYDEYAAPTEQWPSTGAMIQAAADTIERLQRERDASDADCAAYMNKAHERAQRIKVLERHCDELTRRAEEAERELAAAKINAESHRSVIGKWADKVSKTERERDALLLAVPCAIGAIEDAIYLDDGLDGDVGQRTIHILREASERGTFDRADYGTLPRPHSDITLDAVRAALGMDADDDGCPVEAVEKLKRERDEARAELERLKGAAAGVLTHHMTHEHEGDCDCREYQVLRAALCGEG